MPESHQDYSKWVITGRRVYVTNLDWNELNAEWEEVKSIEGEDVTCAECGQVTPSFKPTTNTPSCHATPDGVCMRCMFEIYKKEHGRIFTEDQIAGMLWSWMSELGFDTEVMSEADVTPDNLGKDEDGDEYSYEPGDPVDWFQFTYESRQKMIEYWGGMKAILERLHDEGYHRFCMINPKGPLEVEQEQEHIWESDDIC